MNKGEATSTENGNHFHRYVNYAIALLENYKGKQPFHLYVKKYFSANKKHGSKDRKLITSLCYNYFRLGFGASSELGITEKFLLGTFLVENNSSKFLEKFQPEWNETIHRNLYAKIELVGDIFNPGKIFPLQSELSSDINFEKFSLSLLIQPKLFIRIRPGKVSIVLNKLDSSSISFEKLNEYCLAFSNNEKIGKILSIDRDAVIQDYNSQHTEDLLKEQLPVEGIKISVWDCCAASGGKSILAKDTLKNIELTVSDTRKSILQNLKFRLESAGISNYTSFMADLSVSGSLKEINKFFDVIIADVPCSGSGTWGRTPEQLSFFDKKVIKRYAALQQKIVTNVLRYLKEDGLLLYITCSVFKKENEENVTFIQQHNHLRLIKSEYLKGYEMQADTLFVALFKKVLEFK